MITTRLHGRLGNQMFQYAAAAGLAARVGTQVALDARGAIARGEGVLTRVFDLPLVEPEPQPPLKSDGLLRYGLWRAFGNNPKFRRERGLGYNPPIEGWADGTYLHGYWQSEQYFAHIKDDIRRAFVFPGFSNTQNAEMAARIGEAQAISLHVRRGDYVSLNAHVLCDQGYYETALARILASVEGTPTAFVFSDDPQWAKDNLPLSVEKVVVDFNGPETDFEDMRLMSLCRHNVIGNSSFSWWAAWLNQTPGKQVAGPSKWFGDPNLSNPDVLPADWHRIET